mmetsp:Transcript_110105/g.350765  ORF Transcript_110105/g.350765 Transcript_110105/m.350765 type:complete len:345 (+) Transcript_110105:295-1329(+)
MEEDHLPEGAGRGKTVAAHGIVLARGHAPGEVTRGLDPQHPARRRAADQHGRKAHVSALALLGVFVALTSVLRQVDSGAEHAAPARTGHVYSEQVPRDVVSRLGCRAVEEVLLATVAVQQIHLAVRRRGEGLHTTPPPSSHALLVLEELLVPPVVLDTQHVGHAAAHGHARAATDHHAVPGVADPPRLAHELLNLVDPIRVRRNGETLARCPIGGQGNDAGSAVHVALDRGVFPRLVGDGVPIALRQEASAGAGPPRGEAEGQAGRRDRGGRGHGHATLGQAPGFSEPDSIADQEKSCNGQDDHTHDGHQHVDGNLDGVFTLRCGHLCLRLAAAAFLVCHGALH